MESNPNLALAPSAPPPPAAAGSSDARMRQLQAVLDQFEISIAEANDLVVLEDYQMVIIADDSGSMRTASIPPHMRTLGVPSPTRWDELKETLEKIVELGTVFNPTGIDVHFLNRPPVTSVPHARDPRFQKAFEGDPTGRTPLTETLQRVAAGLSRDSEKKTLLFILTDGEPNGGTGPFAQALRSVVQSSKIRVQIMACTAEDDEIAWLNRLDEELKEVDVTDDYYAEKQEVLRAGRTPKFTKGDWVMKAMLGPVSSKFDAWDEGAKRAGTGTQVTCGPECSIM